MPANINVKTKIIVNGKEYGSPDELPPELRKSYDQAIANKSAYPQMHITGNSKVTFNGQTYNSRDEMPEEVRHIYDNAMDALDKDHGGIPDAPQTGEPAVPPTTGTSAPIAPLPAQQSPISPDQSVNWKTIVTVMVILLVLLAAALVYLRFGR